MDSGDAERLLEKALSGLNRTLDEFLDDRIEEWTARVEANYVVKSPDADPSDQLAEERMSILRNLEKEIMLCSRRDIKLTAGYTSDWWNDFDRLDAMRVDAGLEPTKHPTILTLKAELAILIGEPEQAVTWIQEALDANESYPWKTQERERIRLRFLHTRMLNCAGRYSESLKIADEAARLAESVDTELEKTALLASCTEGKTSVPAGIYALFAACDSRVTHPDWVTSDTLRKEFTFYWNRSIALHSAPSSWNPPLQIATVSDILWRTRVEYRVEEILKSLYVELSESSVEQYMRRFQLFWIGSPVNMPKGIPPKIAAGLLLGTLAIGGIITTDAEAQTFTEIPTSEYVVPAAKYISTLNEFDISVNDAQDYFKNTLTTDELKTPIGEVFANWKSEALRSFEKPVRNEWRIHAHNGEGSAEKI